jgi:hypothetical protein
MPRLVGAFRLQIQTQKTVYSLGETITLRLTITNIGGGTYFIDLQPPSGLTDLIVQDGSGTTLASPGRYTAPRRLGGQELAPGASLVPKYWDNSTPSEGTEWENIVRWGYTLTEAGSYSITAISAITGYTVADGGAHGFTTDQTRSNTLQIQIVK